MIKRSNRFIIYSLVVVCLITFNSCKKETAEASQVSLLSIINTAPSLSTFNVYLNDDKANPAALPFGGNLNYLQLNAGDYDVKFTLASSVESLLSRKITLTANTRYSLYLIDRIDKLDGLLITDVLNTSSDKAFLRFINLSPDAPALDLAVSGSPGLIVNNSYKAASKFIEIDPKAYAFDVKESSSGALKTSLTSITLRAGVHYTIIARGLLTPHDTEQDFSTQIIENK